MTTAGHEIKACRTLLVVLLGALVVHRQCRAVQFAKAEQTATNEQQQYQQQQQQQQQHQQHSTNAEQLHPSLLVDTKFWVRNTQFDETLNWRNRLRPCTLRERVQINEEAVVSLADSFDEQQLAGARTNAPRSLESDEIRQLVLAPNGVLLLENFSAPTGSAGDNNDSKAAYVDYLKDLGDCQESDWLASEQKVFYFEPDSDLLSWFNSANWRSLLNVDEIVDWVPDSHSIPCQEDVVVFGSRHAALMATLEGNERAELLSFKVNFRPAKSLTSQLANVTVANLRVSKLKIGEQVLNQQKFDRLTQSGVYENILFQFDDRDSALRPNAETRTQTMDGYQTQQFLTIDETSIQLDPTNDLCADEAGCLCGNEEPNVMQLICSFNLPLDQEQLPCRDPIQAPGYCNKICATSLVIIMDPTVFSERYLTNTLRTMMEEAQDESGISLDYYSENLFIGARRVSHNRYEVTFRLVPSTGVNFEDLLGFDVSFANLLRRKLENVATRSFYGIRSIDIRSSADWRRNNRQRLFWLTWVLLLPIVLLAGTSDLGKPSIEAALASLVANYVSNQFEKRRTHASDGDTETMVNETLILDEMDGPSDERNYLSDPLSNIALVELDGDDSRSAQDLD